MLLPEDMRMAVAKRLSALVESELRLDRAGTVATSLDANP